MREVTRRTLETFGLQVIAAADGSSGAAACAANQSEIAAVITDMWMPGLDGRRLTRAAQTLQTHD